MEETIGHQIIITGIIMAGIFWGQPTTEGTIMAPTTMETAILAKRTIMVQSIMEGTIMAPTVMQEPILVRTIMA